MGFTKGDKVYYIDPKTSEKFPAYVENTNVLNQNIYQVMVVAYDYHNEQLTVERKVRRVNVRQSMVSSVLEPRS